MLLLALSTPLPTQTAPASAQETTTGLTVRDLNHGVQPQDLVYSLVGSGVTVSNVAFSGSSNAAGTFTGGNGIIGFDSGIVLGTGRVQTLPTLGPCSKGVEGPNQCDGNTTGNGTPGART